jgi:hypothetical protein
MKQPLPLGLRLVLVLIAIIAAGGVGYVLYNADKYLFDMKRWLMLGGGIVLAAAVLGLAFRWRAFATYLALTSISVSAALYGAEFVLGIAQTAPTSGGSGLLSATVATDMIRSAEAKGQRLRPIRNYKATITIDAEGRHHSRIQIRQQEVMKLGGPSKSRALFRDLVGQKWIEVKTDRYGHINDDDIWQQGPIDVLVVGASNTKGAGARPGNDFVSLLKGKNRSVARLALGGIGPLSKLGMVREFGPLLKPRIVFWVYADHNDLEDDLKREMKTPVLANYLNAGYRQNLPALEAELDRAVNAMVMEHLSRQESRSKDKKQAKAGATFDWNGFAKLSRLRARLGIVVGTPVTAAQLAAWAATMKTANQDIRAWDGRMVFVYLPMISTLRTGSDDRFKPYVLNVLRDLKVPFIDFTADLAVLTDPTIIYRLADGSMSDHYNEDGHRRLARSLAKFLQRDTAID